MSAERIQAELGEFLAGRLDWPTQDEFDAAGRATLRRALNRFGGQERWADEFILDLPCHRRRRPSWTDDRIEAELRRLIAASNCWPAKRVFEQAGLVSLDKAIMKRGTRGHWARTLGVPAPPKHATTPLRWTDVAIDRALSDLLEGGTACPPRGTSQTPVSEACTSSSVAPLAVTSAGRAATGSPAQPAGRADAARAAYARRRARERSALTEQWTTGAHTTRKRTK